MTVTFGYHDVTAPGSEYPGMGAGVTNYFVSREAFAEQMEAVRGLDVAVTFDDGWAGSVDNAAETLEAHGRTAILFVTSGLIGRRHFANAAKLREAADSGLFEVGGHGVTHRLLGTLPFAEAKREMADCKDAIEQAVGRPVTAFAAPGGSIDGRLADAARECGYDRVYGSRPGVHRPPDGVARRVAVMRDTPAWQVKAWADGHFGTATLRFQVLDAAKRLLGRARYVRVRAALLGSTGDLDMTDLLPEDLRREYGIA